ncbi:MAG: hypothetical protein NTY77_16390 [Elusimicrobia bacterium]|nr:hypothetical protein [Elusimicrobiota bacterium]
MKKLLPVCLALSVAGCAIKRPLSIPSAAMGPGPEEVVGTASGAARENYFFGFPQASIIDYASRAAILDALQKRPDADTLIDVVGDSECEYFPFRGLCLYCFCDVRLTGTAIRYGYLARPRDHAEAPDTAASRDIKSLRRLFSGMNAGTPIRITFLKAQAQPVEGVFRRYNSYGRDSISVRPVDGGFFSTKYPLEEIRSVESLATQPAQRPEPVPAASTTTATEPLGGRVKDGHLELSPSQNSP